MKCFLLNLEKKFGIRLVVFDKNAHFLKNNVTSRRLGYSNHQLKSSLQVKGQFQTSRNRGFRKSETNCNLLHIYNL